MPLSTGVFSIYSLDPKFIWLPRPKWLKQEMTHIPGIGGVKRQPKSLESPLVPKKQGQLLINFSVNNLVLVQINV